MIKNRFILLMRVLVRSKWYLWYGGYRKHLKETQGLKLDKLVDIIVLMVDHYEPAKKDGNKAVDTVIDWCENYKNISKKFVDSDGVHPQHSWFYRYDFPEYKIINELSRYVFEGFGEIEFHLHHGFDTSKTFNDKIEKGVRWFNTSGAMLSAEKVPKKSFAYIAGNWALDNGRKDPQFSGVNDEILTLKKHGCYADYTFPAIGWNAQPKKVNSIYYVVDDPDKPKSYNTGVDVEVNGKVSGDLMMVQGPVFLGWENGYPEYANFEFYAPYEKGRLKYWERAHVHVKGRPEWIFVKLHTHGMQSKKIYTNGNFSDLCQALDKTFNNDAGYRLHYVTAREAYNIIKAAENGLSGNPNAFRNYLIKEPVNKKVHVNKPYTLITWSNDEIIFEIDQPEDATEAMIHMMDNNLLIITGDCITIVKVNLENGELKAVEMDGVNCRYETISA